MATTVVVLEILLKAQKYFPVRMPAEGATYPERWFRQNVLQFADLWNVTL
jgi:hypothetical protein